MPQLSASPIWNKLKTHLTHWTTYPPKRASDARIDGLKVDFSNANFSAETLSLLFQLAKDRKLPEMMQQFFKPNQLNHTENRAVHHQSMRFASECLEEATGGQIANEIQRAMMQMERISDEIRSGSYQGANIKHVIHIGIGGSDWGPRMASMALKAYCEGGPSVDFISHLDAAEIYPLLARLKPSQTLLIISSKSFTTHETLINAKIALQWLGEERVNKQCIAITSNSSAANALGIKNENILPMWDWIGGRYSIWSTVGLSVAIQIGFPAFRAFLEGAYEVDKHIKAASLEDNLPLKLALLDCWHINFLAYETRAVIPYSSRLGGLVSYLQQLVMESNGKSVTMQGQPVDYQTGPIIWGGMGPGSQHTFHQLLMQGTQRIFVDFVSVKKADDPKHQPMQNLLCAELKAQSEALTFGNASTTQSPHHLVQGGVPHYHFELDALTPKTLGTFLALYEYRTILTGFLWNINPFDQFGVELGKLIGKQNQRAYTHEPQQEPSL